MKLKEPRGVEDLTLVEYLDSPYPYTHAVRAIRRLHAWYNDPHWYLDQLADVVRYLDSVLSMQEIRVAALLYAYLDLFSPWRTDPRYVRFSHAAFRWLSTRNLTMRRVGYRHVWPLKVRDEQ